MSSQIRSGSSLGLHQVKERSTKRYKARLPILQRLSYSVGHFLNDAVVNAWSSYLLVFLTRVVGMSNRTAGFLFIVSYTTDAALGVLIGYICDSLKFPFLAKYYGKRKSFHILGTILVAGLFPLLMMPCFVCEEDSSQWKMGLYYGTIMILHNIGWSLSQCTHLALIPEIAQRPREMVELQALRSGITFISGIFMYAITWILLKTDGGDQRISDSQWKDFMEMALIVVGTGCFFCLVFHLGTKETPTAQQSHKAGPSNDVVGPRETQKSCTVTLPLPDKAVGVFCLYDESDISTMPADCSPTEEQSTAADIVLENKLCDSFEKKGIEVCVLGLEETKRSKDFCFSNPAFKAQPTTDCEEAVVVTPSESSGTETSAKTLEQPRKENEFSFSNPAFISENNQSTDSETLQETNEKESDQQHENLMEERLSNGSDSSGYSEGYASSPETDSVYSTDGSVTENKPQAEQGDCMKIEISSQAIPTALSSCQSSRNSFRERSKTICSEVSVVIVKVSECNTKGINYAKKTWTDWFKTPMFYKVSFAYMCTRLVQIITASYAPMYLTDTLDFEKESIAYFPLVILISGVFSSLGAKKLDKMLGAKWTYCLASSLVIGSSAWFYLQSPSGRNAAYCAAILTGCGGSVMYVTSLALAGELIGDNRESGAFVFGSTCALGKVVCGGSVFFIQEFFPSHGSTAQYVRYVFSVVPGAVSILGFLAVIAFLPATMRCRKVVHTVDSSVQTEDLSDVPYAYENPALYDDNSKQRACST